MTRLISEVERLLHSVLRKASLWSPIAIASSSVSPTDSCDGFLPEGSAIRKFPGKPNFASHLFPLRNNQNDSMSTMGNPTPSSQIYETVRTFLTGNPKKLIPDRCYIPVKMLPVNNFSTDQFYFQTIPLDRLLRIPITILGCQISTI